MVLNAKVQHPLWLSTATKNVTYLTPRSPLATVSCKVFTAKCFQVELCNNSIIKHRQSSPI